MKWLIVDSASFVCSLTIRLNPRSTWDLEMFNGRAGIQCACCSESRVPSSSDELVSWLLQAHSMVSFIRPVRSCACWSERACCVNAKVSCDSGSINEEFSPITVSKGSIFSLWLSILSHTRTHTNTHKTWQTISIYFCIWYFMCLKQKSGYVGFTPTGWWKHAQTHSVAQIKWRKLSVYTEMM